MLYCGMHVHVSLFHTILSLPFFAVPDITDSCKCAQSDNTAAVISGVVVAVAFMITTAIIVIAVLVLRYHRGNNFTGRKEKYNDFMSAYTSMQK